MKYYILNLVVEIGDGYDFSSSEYIPVYIYKNEESATAAKDSWEEALQHCVTELINLPPQKIWNDFWKGKIGDRNQELADEASEAYDKYCKDRLRQEKEIFEKYKLPYIDYYEIERLGEADFVITECEGDD